MSDGNQAGMLSVDGAHNGTGPLWAPDEPMALGDQPAEFATGLVSLAYIKAAIRRSARFCCVVAIIGLLAGLGYEIALPPAYQASTSVILPQDGQNSSSDAIATDMALAQSRAVAGLTVHMLGVPLSAASFQNTYTVTDPTNEVLVIMATASSGGEAVRRAHGVAAAFLRFRANLEETQAKIALVPLDQQISQANRQIKSVDAQISALSAQPASAAHQARLNNLQSELGQATSALTSANANVTNTTVQTALQVRGSKVLDDAYLLPHSRLKGPALAGAIGLMAGLALAVGVVTLRAVVSDRLRWRDDVAHALGAPVRLSVGAVRVDRRPSGPRALGVAARPEMRRIVDHLWDAVPKDSRRSDSLAVVAVDDPRIAALSIAALAVAQAQAGIRVVLADLTSGAPAARVLDSAEPGIRTIRVQGTHMVLAVPGADEVLPVGPQHRSGRLADHMPPRGLMEAFASADLLLTLATLDPSLGADHLRTWTTDAVVMVSAGRSSWTRVRSAGEMIRLADIQICSAILVGADKSDDGLGLPAPEMRRNRGEEDRPAPEWVTR